MERTCAWARLVARGALLSLLVGCGGAAPNEQGYISAPASGDMTYAELRPARFDAELDAACGAGGMTPPGLRELPRRPYLQKVTFDAAEVLFTSTVDRPFRIVARSPAGSIVADAPAMLDADAQPTSGKQYVAALAGLPASSTVCYQVVAGDEVLTELAGFRTAPAPGTASTVRFAALGDLGERNSDQFAVLKQLQQVPMDLMLITGDLAYRNGTRAEIEANFFGVYRDILAKVPVFPAAGNHDYRTDDARPFREAFSLFTNSGEEGKERWYSFDWGPVHIVVLDTEKLGSEQLAWLDTDLGGHDRSWTIVVSHRPPYSSGDHGSDVDIRDALAPLLRKHRVPLVLSGHDHNYERTKSIEGVVYVVTGGGGVGTRPVAREGFTAVSQRVSHFVWLEASETQLRLVAVDGTGKPFDSVGFERTAAGTERSE